MPPQQGIFPVPYGPPHTTTAHGKARAGTYAADVSDMGMSYHPHHHPSVAGPSSRLHEDGKKEKRRKDIAGKLGKEIVDRRDDGRHFNEHISSLHHSASLLAARPDKYPLYQLPLEMDERHAIYLAQTAYDEERERVEEEWKKGRERVRERLLEGIEERRRKAREEKDGEGTVGDGALTPSRPPITRKLRNKIGTSPPPTPLGAQVNGLTASSQTGTLAITTGPVFSPHSLSVDEIPSPFPLPLTATPSNGGTTNTVTVGPGGGRRKPKGGGPQGQPFGALGKSLVSLVGCKEVEVESDLGEIRRGGKRRRAAVGASKA
ncbi:hypothetical protein BDQ17DRAFT_1391667 [Cyathus striatus]|nr:hypothetical protein BDQ17DRAFT_1391667 [Cyathus striatus]